MEPRHAAEFEARLPVLLETFYERVRKDPELGPVFEAAVHDWPAHLDLLADFWSSVTLASGRYKGAPVPAHQKLAAALTPGMFDRWLGLWRDVTAETAPPEVAAELQAKAERIARSLQLAVGFRLPPCDAGPGPRRVVARPAPATAA